MYDSTWQLPFAVILATFTVVVALLLGYAARVLRRDAYAFSQPVTTAAYLPPVRPASDFDASDTTPMTPALAYYCPLCAFEEAQSLGYRTEDGEYVAPHGLPRFCDAPRWHSQTKLARAAYRRLCDERVGYSA